MSTTEQSDGTHPDIPEKSWQNPFPDHHPLHDLYERRIKHNQDLVILLDDYHARRGTGKTVASLQLAQGMDQHGSLTKDHVSMSPEEIRNAYFELPERSGIVFDEGEVGASNRESMTNSNKALREIVSMGRIEEKYVVINTPSIGFIDKDLRLLADVWMMMLAKGIALVLYFERQPFGGGASGKLLTPKKGLIQFRDIQRGTELRTVYNWLTRKKKEHIRGEEGSSFVPMSEHKKKVEQVKEKERRKVRDELIKEFYEHPEHDVSQRSIGEAVGLTQPQVGKIIREVNNAD